MSAEATELLHGLWYVAAHGGKLKRGSILPVTLLSQQVLLGRDAEGKVFALKDFCPHRGIPLRYGNFDGKEIECCYHGWRFDTCGGCTHIPALLPEDTTDVSRIKTGNFPCEERDGLIWVFMPGENTEPLPVPMMPVEMPGGFRLVESVLFPCPVDHAVIGLMDPSHGPFVHRSWWWRSRKSIHAKQKKFAPFGMGFKMVSHKPSSNSRAYRILFGGELTTEISFQLPALRMEHIRAGKHHVLLLTALTPVDGQNTQLHQFLYTSMPLLKFLLPLLLPFGRAFIRQDLEIVKKQQEGLRNSTQPLLLLGDADAQARWYYKLKREWQEAQGAGRGFENRLKERVLKWRS